jgi:hypothetical protein
VTAVLVGAVVVLTLSNVALALVAVYLAAEVARGSASDMAVRLGHLDAPDREFPLPGTNQPTGATTP